MNTAQLFLFAYLTGLTVTCLFSAIAEAIARRPVGFNPPFVGHGHVLRSLAVTGFAGPTMLLNDTLDAWRAGQFPPAQFAAVCVLVNGWVLALGIVFLEATVAVFAQTG